MAWLTPTIAFVFLLAGVFNFFNRRVRAMFSPVSRFVGGAMIFSLILVVVGLVFGGLAYGQGAIKSLGHATASLTDTGAPEVAGVVSSTMLERCDYTSGTGLTGNTTLRADPNSNNRVFLDIDKSEFSVYEATAGNSLNVTFTCVRSGSAQEAESYQIVVKGDEFRSETSTTDSATYNILQTTATPSTIWSGKYKQTIYVAGDTTSPTYATTSDTREYGYLNFAAGSKTGTLGLYGEPDNSSFNNLNTYTQKSVHIYQRVGTQDNELAQVTVNVLP